MHVQSLDLRGSPVRDVDLFHVQSDAPPRLPAGLHGACLASCTFPEPQQACLAPLRELRRLEFDTYVEHDLDVPGLLARNPRLRRVEVFMQRLRTAPGDKMHVAETDLMLEDTCDLAPGSEAATSLRLVLRRALPSLDIVDPAALQSLHLVLSSTCTTPTLRPLRACTRLWCLCIEGTRDIATLGALAGHPALREVHMLRYSQNLDVAALLSCPRLQVADLRKIDVAPAQLAALMAYIQANSTRDA